MDLTALLQETISPSTKGFPGRLPATKWADIGQLGLHLLKEDLPFPVAVLKESALAHNSDWMRRFLQRSGAVISPHGKTTMAPQLFQRQLADGAWGITLANIAQVQVARQFGLSRILLANQLVGREALRYLASEFQRDNAFEFYSLIDSIEQVNFLAREWKSLGVSKPLKVLLELGYAGARTGVRTQQQGLAVATVAKQHGDQIRLVGVEGFEGVISGATPEESAEKVRSYLAELVGLAKACEQQNLLAEGELILSAGGTQFYDLVTQILPAAKFTRPVTTIVRSGCYLTHDGDLFNELQLQMEQRSPDVQSLGSPPKNALEVWSYVQSRPEPNMVVLGLGKRDASYDIRMPKILTWFRPGFHDKPQPIPDGHKILRLNDQHAVCEVPSDSPMVYGDLIGCGISHPCTTFDKWQLLYLVDDDYRVLGAIRTFF